MQTGLGSGEVGIIIDCCKKELNPKYQELNKRDYSNIKWENFLEGVPIQLLVVVHNNISTSSLSKKVKNALKQRVLSEHKRRLMINISLKEIAHKFKKEKVPLILLKGFVLEKKIYAPTTRLFEDLDILVKEKDLQRAEKALKELNYSLETEVFPEGYYRKYKQHLIFSRKDTRVGIELHTSLTEPYAPFNIKSQALFKNSKPLKIKNIKTRILSNEHILMTLCLHFVYIDTYQDPIRYSYEISTFINRNRIKWSELIRTCNSTNASAFIYQGISFSRRVYNTQVPEPVLKRLRKNSKKGTLALLRLFSPKKLKKSWFIYSKVRKWLIKILVANTKEKRIMVLKELSYSYKYLRRYKKSLKSG